MRLGLGRKLEQLEQSGAWKTWTTGHWSLEEERAEDSHEGLKNWSLEEERAEGKIEEMEAWKREDEPKRLREEKTEDWSEVVKNWRLKSEEGRAERSGSGILKSGKQAKIGCFFCSLYLPIYIKKKNRFSVNRG